MIRDPVVRTFHTKDSATPARVRGNYDYAPGATPVGTGFPLGYRPISLWDETCFGRLTRRKVRTALAWLMIVCSASACLWSARRFERFRDSLRPAYEQGPSLRNYWVECQTIPADSAGKSCDYFFALRAAGGSRSLGPEVGAIQQMAVGRFIRPPWRFFVVWRSRMAMRSVPGLAVWLRVHCFSPASSLCLTVSGVKPTFMAHRFSRIGRAL